MHQCRINEQKIKEQTMAGRTTMSCLVRWLALLLLWVALSSCQPGEQEGIPQEASSTPSAEMVTATVSATSTPTPTPVPEEFIAFLPADVDQEFASQVLGAFGALAEEHGMVFHQEGTWNENLLSAQVRAVAFIREAPDLRELAPRFPDIHFFLVDVYGAEAGDNVSLIGALGSRPDRQGFIAGYLAAVITHDWRVGIITQADTTSGKAARLGFQNGAIFYCGLCRPVYPPYFQYPVFAEIPSTANDIEQRNAVDVLLANAVQSVYVYPTWGNRVIIPYLVENGVQVIGAIDPPSGMEAHWVATIRPDWEAAIRRAWENFMQQGLGMDLEPPIVILNRNAQWFSPGKQQLVEKILTELLQGWIETGVDPISGAPTY